MATTIPIHTLIPYTFARCNEGVTMQGNKVETQITSSPTCNFFQQAPPDITGLIAGHLPINTFLHFMRVNRWSQAFFKPRLLPQKARACVVQGDLPTLKIIAQKDPEALLQKGVITDPRGRIFYDVSAYQLIHFLCDVNMKEDILPLIPKSLKARIDDQVQSLGCGGADLIRLNRSPVLLDNNLFKGMTQVKQTLTIHDGTQQDVAFTLLENVEGIIYYQDNNKEVHYYYANQNTQTITPLEPTLQSEKERSLMATLNASFDAMEMNSSRRSSNAEHQWINRLFRIQLHRDGIHYEHHGVHYQDSRSSFNIINAYRTSIRLYSEAAQNHHWEKAHTHWREVVGKAQGVEMWVLQRLCEKDQEFAPPPDRHRFIREVTFYNKQMTRFEPVLIAGKLVAGLGTDFTLCKGALLHASAQYLRDVARYSPRPAASTDLVAICRLVEESKTHIIAQQEKQVLAFNPAK